MCSYNVAFLSLLALGTDGFFPSPGGWVQVGSRLQWQQMLDGSICLQVSLEDSVAGRIWGLQVRGLQQGKVDRKKARIKFLYVANGCVFPFVLVLFVEKSIFFPPRKFCGILIRSQSSVLITLETRVHSNLVFCCYFFFF